MSTIIGNTTLKPNIQGNVTSTTTTFIPTTTKIPITTTNTTHKPKSTNDTHDKRNEYDNYYDMDNLIHFFTTQKLALVLWFLAIFLISYLVLSMFITTNTSAESTYIGFYIDFIFLISLFLFVGSYYYNKDSNYYDLVNVTIDKTKKYIDEPSSIFTSMAFIFVFYFTIYLFRIPMSSNSKPFSISFIEILSWVLLVVIIFADFFKYFLKISLVGLAKDIFQKSFYNDIGNDISDILGNINIDHDKKHIDHGNYNQLPIVGNIITNSNNIFTNHTEEVFNISDNLYTYDDAQHICTAFGGKLATYDQIENAYNDGAEWCNYGWSSNQMALFPTQKNTWDMLQKTEKHKHDCGRPGINGGFFDNSGLKFGVNCYGKKPDPNTSELDLMNASKNRLIPENIVDEKTNYWKNKIKDMPLNSFNYYNWHEDDRFKKNIINTTITTKVPIYSGNVVVTSGNASVTSGNVSNNKKQN